MRGFSSSVLVSPMSRLHAWGSAFLGHTVLISDLTVEVAWANERAEDAAILLRQQGQQQGQHQVMGGEGGQGAHVRCVCAHWHWKGVRGEGWVLHE